MGALADDEKVALAVEERGAAGTTAAPGRAAAVSRRLHWNLLPIFLLMATLCYIDRTNSAFAALQMTADLHFDAETYGLGSGLFFVGYSLAMIPSQLLMMHVGAPRWLSCIVTAWGLTAMSFAFMQNRTQFFVLRLLLGMSESGAFPAMWHYLSSFYPADQVTVPFSLIEAAVGFANVCGAPLAAGLLMLDGARGWHGWQWLFLLEGLPSVATGVAMAYLLPRDYQSSRFLSNADKAWLSQALAPQKKHAQEAEGLGHAALLADAARNGRVWLVGLAALLKNAAMVGILFWCPLIVQTLLTGGTVDLGATGAALPTAHGHHHHHHHRHLMQAAAAAAASSNSSSTAAAAAAAAASAAASSSRSSGGGDRGVAAVLLTAIPFITAASGAVWLGHRSQRLTEKCGHVAIPYALAAALFVLFPSIASLGGAWAFLCLTAAITALTAPNAILNSLASAVSAGPSSAVGLALYNAVGNLGGLCGPWLIGRVVKATGLYASALQALGVMVAAAGAIAAYMRRWNL